jgi:periplasmic divalent cation tolerance protein
MDDSEFVVIYSTYPDAASAKKTAAALVEAKLAACVNIHSPITSIYEWQGRQEVTSETAIFIKTRRALAEIAITTARAQHPYTLPCFLALPIVGGNADYLDWLRQQTRQTS